MDWLCWAPHHRSGAHFQCGTSSRGEISYTSDNGQSTFGHWWDICKALGLKKFTTWISYACNCTRVAVSYTFSRRSALAGRSYVTSNELTFWCRHIYEGCIYWQYLQGKFWKYCVKNQQIKKGPLPGKPENQQAEEAWWRGSKHFY